MAKPVFYDPKQRRWRVLWPVQLGAGILLSLIIVITAGMILHGEDLPPLLLPDQRKPYHALKEKEKRKPTPKKTTHRKTKKPPSNVVLNSGEGIRAAFYVTWDPTSLASLRQYVHQIDLLYPEWLHVITPDGRMQGQTQDGVMFDVVTGTSVHPVDDKVMPLLQQEKAETEVFPLVNNYDPAKKIWLENIGGFFADAAARANFRAQALRFLASGKFSGLTLDFEAFPPEAQPGFRALLAELYGDLHAKNLKLYVNVPTDDNDYDYRFIAAHCDGVIIMNYDQHSADTPNGPIASQDWFTKNVSDALKVIPREKLIVAVANYAYDWEAPAKKPKGYKPAVETETVQEAWLHAFESEAPVALDPDTLNPHYAYMEGDMPHDVWLLDAVSALNQMRAAHKLGISTFALWRLGSEDRALWAIWDNPADNDAPNKLAQVPPGHEVDTEGQGEVLRISERPASGARTVSVDGDMVVSETFSSLPMPYQIEQYGWHKDQVAISFDDGPDPRFTPQVLDILKQKDVKATFFLIGAQAQNHINLTRRIYDEGHTIGNHTFTHPNISDLSGNFMKLEMNLTEQLFAAKLGAKPLFFRPPYSIDQNPEIDDEVKPLEVVQDMGYTTVGSNLDPHDWAENPRPSAEAITASILAQLKTRPGCITDPCGNIILLHDGGGDRTQTVRALPMIIDALRARGYTFVSVPELLGKTRADVMPAVSGNERWFARVSSLAFSLEALLFWSIYIVFFAGDVLMTARLLFVGAFAVYDRVHKSVYGEQTDKLYSPAVAVLIPAYNEEKVIERTVRAALASEYPNLRVIVIDDGSSDATLAVAQQAFAPEIKQGRVLVLTKPNSGKADALNFGLQHVTEDVFLGIDADTVIAPTAVRRIVRHFSHAEVAAVAGNAKVGNRMNFWTRLQALEYLTSQNFERRALNVVGAISVVPGAIGAWRTSAVRAAGGYQANTVAEDADLTMSLLERGGRIEYEDRAVAFTEAPTTRDGLMRQRFRWSFGILQAVWKHRKAFFRNGSLGWIALPNVLVFQILLPLVSPFIDIMYLFGVTSYLIQKYFHPEAPDPRNLEILTLYFLLFLIIDFVASAVAFSLERRETGMEERFWLLSQIWVQRLVYRWLFSWVLFRTLKRAIDGRPFAWDKLERTATVRQPGVKATPA